MLKVLVTGAGAVLGQGVLRCLRGAARKMEIHTADPEIRSAGHWLGNKAHIVPFANQSNYLSRLEYIIESEGINLLMVGTDTELPILSQSRAYLEKKYDMHVVVSDPQLINIANDKWLTAEFLRKNSFPFPYSALTSNEAGVAELRSKASYPYIAKPVDGARSKGIVIIENESMLLAVTSKPNNLVVQEFLPDAEGEYTTGCIVYNGHCKAIVTLRRDLRDGNTYRAYYDKSCEKFNNTIRSVAETLDVNGPCNFQFRVRDGVPVIFEINARFSGTTPIRHMFGFNEVEAVVEYLTERKDIEQPSLKAGIVMRAWADIFVDKEQMDDFANAQALKMRAPKYYPFLA